MSNDHSLNITALFHNMLNAIVNNEAGFCDLILAGEKHNKQCEFTLPQLFECFSQLDGELAKLSYLEFRKALFNSPINKEMKKRGGEIIIRDNTGKVDESVYCLELIGVQLKFL